MSWRYLDASERVYQMVRDAGYSVSDALWAARADASGRYGMRVALDPDYAPWGVPWLVALERRRLAAGLWQAWSFALYERCPCCAGRVELDALYGIVADSDREARVLGYVELGSYHRRRRLGPSRKAA